ncbi:MAG: hypothetical protein U5J99_13140 [Parvularculaceae bacterium]|nr:hypothetical protein [Parvularculaceae bacterium]
MTMTRRRAGALIAGGAGMAFVPGCGAGGGEARLKFKVIARAQLPGADYEGFAVNEMRASYTPNSLTGFMMGRTLKMEATVVDFGGEGDALFVLLTDYLPVILWTWGIAPSAGAADEKTISSLKAATGLRAIPQEDPALAGRYSLYPKLCAFRDEADPTSVYEVDPDNLAKTHGPGAKFLGLSIEIVDPKTPLTTSIMQRLPWLSDTSGKGLVPAEHLQPMRELSFGQLLTNRDFRGLP